MKKTVFSAVSLLLALWMCLSCAGLTLETAKEALEAAPDAETAALTAGALVSADTAWINSSATDGAYASASFTLTIAAESFTVDVGNTRAAWEQSGDKIIVTAAGYPGTVSVTATGGGETETASIRFVGRDNPKSTSQKFIPGVDLLSGTDAGFSFDNTAEELALVGNCSLQSSRKYDALDDNYYIAFTCSSASPFAWFDVFFPVETLAAENRPVQVYFDYRGNKTQMWQMGATNLPLSVANGNTSWTPFNYKLTSAVYNDSWSNPSLRWQTQKTTSDAMTFDIDNLAILPYYKVTYHGLAGETVVDYVLPANGVFTPDLSKISGATGYVDAGGDPVTSLTLNHEDVELYAVVESQLVAANDEWIKASATDGVYASTTFTLSDDAESFTVDVGNTRAAWEQSGDTITVTAAGYPGVVSVTATGNGKTVTASVRFVGRDNPKSTSQKFIPGVDLLSGTDAGFSFDNTAEELALVGNCSLQSSRKYDTANDNYYIAFTCSNGYPYAWFDVFFPVETLAAEDRPVQVYFDYRGNKTQMWQMGATNMALGVVNGNTAWTPFTYKLTSAVYNDSWSNPSLRWQTQKTTSDAMTFDMDNLALIPYYKVTYHGLSGETVTDYVLPADGVFIPDVSKIDGATGYEDAEGNTVTSVTLAHEDITLYAVDDPIMTYVSASGIQTVPLTSGVSYTIEDCADTNFRVWKEGNNVYYPGQVIADGASLSGKTLKALCFEEKLFDPEKGDLVYFFNYDTSFVANVWTPSFINPAYATALQNDRFDGSTYSFTEDNGEPVMQLTSRNQPVQMFGYWIPYTAQTLGSKLTVAYDAKYLTSYEDTTALIRLVNTSGTSSETFEAQSIYVSGYEQNVWNRIVKSSVDTENNGWRGGVVQHNVSNDGTEYTQYVDNFAMYVYPAGTFAIKASADAEDATKVVCDGDTYTFTAESGVIAYTDGENLYMPGTAYDVADLQFKAFWPADNADMAPTIKNTVSMRTTGNCGLRFSAFVGASLSDAADEYGFLLTRASFFNDDYTDFVFAPDTTYTPAQGVTISCENNGKRFVAGTSYNAAADIANISPESNDSENGFRFNGVAVGLSGRNQYVDTLAARAYVKIGDSRFYSGVKTASLYNAAKALAELGDDSEYVRNVIAAVEGN